MQHFKSNIIEMQNTFILHDESIGRQNVNSRKSREKVSLHINVMTTHLALDQISVMNGNFKLEFLKNQNPVNFSPPTTTNLHYFHLTGRRRRAPGLRGLRILRAHRAGQLGLRLREEGRARGVC